MVLDNLGDSLKRTLKKIANAVHVDAKLVKEVVRDIQRALLQADVNVKLVVELSKTIEKRSLEEKPPAGMSNREHVIHIVYDELVNILGESRELPIKKQIIMMVGLYGQGKCVHPQSNISLSSGDIITAEQLYEKYRVNYEEDRLDDGSIIDVSSADIYVPSFNPKTLRNERKKVSHLWKLQGKHLLQVSLDAGNDFSVKVTPEHPFFILRNGNFLKIRADELRSDDYVAVPREYSITGKEHDLFTDLKQHDFDVIINPSSAKTILHSRFDIILEAVDNLNYKRNYCSFTLDLKKGRVPIQLLEGTDVPRDYLTLKSKKSHVNIRFPRFLTCDLAEFLGYFIGDGHLTTTYVEIISADTEIINRVKTLSSCLFGIKPYVKKDKRSNAYKIVLASTTLASIFKNLFHFPPGKKGPNLSIPDCMLSSSDLILSRFIQAYFDCDGSICKSYRNIEITSESRILIKQINLILHRFGIFSCVSIKRVHAKPYWKLCIEARYT